MKYVTCKLFNDIYAAKMGTGVSGRFVTGKPSLKFINFKLFSS